jgi:hypothetical protein
MIQGGRWLDLRGKPFGLRSGRGRGSIRPPRPYAPVPFARSAISVEMAGDGADGVIVRIPSKQLSTNAEEAPDVP